MKTGDMLIGIDPAQGTDRSCVCVRAEIGFLYFGENYIAASLWTNFYSEFLRRVHTKQLMYRKYILDLPEDVPEHVAAAMNQVFQNADVRRLAFGDPESKQLTHPL